ncbi:hypothetical protein DFP72DRAFT_852361 [Ephemerocybe angulata]|uniref:Uncharacterized protein n=1 Tax=Ephemerocybe angulata TaxID=980116 RepID=A0A8H6HNN1_9AGAR|nr:hypothetical protein DFP72DRAFT_852361 [Tulosesus angulatus]
MRDKHKWILQLLQTASDCFQLLPRLEVLHQQPPALASPRQPHRNMDGDNSQINLASTSVTRCSDPTRRKYQEVPLELQRQRSGSKQEARVYLHVPSARLRPPRRNFEAHSRIDRERRQVTVLKETVNSERKTGVAAIRVNLSAGGAGAIRSSQSGQYILCAVLTNLSTRTTRVGRTRRMHDTDDVHGFQPKSWDETGESEARLVMGPRVPRIGVGGWVFAGPSFGNDMTEGIESNGESGTCREQGR